MTMTFKKALLISLILHALAIVPFSMSSPDNGQGSSSQNTKQQNENKARGPITVDLKVFANESDNENERMSKKEDGDGISFKKEDCPNQYIGIGVVYNVITGIIMDTNTNTPAYKAGIRVGDVLIDNRPSYEEGKSYDILIMRNKLPMTFRVKAGKICSNRGNP